MTEIQIGEHKSKVPGGWDELTFAQFFGIKQCDPNDLGALLEILTKIPRSVWYKAEVEAVEKKALPLLEWMRSTPQDFSTLPMPKKIRIGDNEFDIPRDLDSKSWGQKIATEQELKRCESDLYKGMNNILAIYFQPLLTGQPFDYDRHDEFIPIVAEGVRMYEAYPIACFFLRKLLGSGNLIPIPSESTNPSESILSPG